MARRAVAAPARPTAALEDLIEEYLEHLAARTRPPTVIQRRRVLTRTFMPWAIEQGVTTADDLTTALLDRWSRHLQADGGTSGNRLSPTSIQTYVRNLNLFLAWVAENAGGDPGLKAAAPMVRQRVIDVLTRREIDRIEAAATNPRDKLMIRLLADTGIRAGELLGMRARDVMRQEGETWIRVSGKTGDRDVGITVKLYRLLDAYIRVVKLADEDHLFKGRGRRSALTVSGLRQVVACAAEIAGIAKGERGTVYPHLLRHSFATWYLEQGGDPLILARDLGHQSLNMIHKVYYHVAGAKRHGMLRKLLQEKG